MKTETYICDVCGNQSDDSMQNGPVTVNIITNYVYRVFTLLEYNIEHICGTCVFNLEFNTQQAVTKFIKENKRNAS